MSCIDVSSAAPHSLKQAISCPDRFMTGVSRLNPCLNNTIFSFCSGCCCMHAIDYANIAAEAAYVF